VQLFSRKSSTPNVTWHSPEHLFLLLLVLFSFHQMLVFYCVFCMNFLPWIWALSTLVLVCPCNNWKFSNFKHGYTLNSFLNKLDDNLLAAPPSGLPIYWHWKDMSRTQKNTKSDPLVPRWLDINNQHLNMSSTQKSTKSDLL